MTTTQTGPALTAMFNGAMGHADTLAVLLNRSVELKEFNDLSLFLRAFADHMDAQPDENLIPDLATAILRASVGREGYESGADAMFAMLKRKPELLADVKAVMKEIMEKPEKSGMRPSLIRILTRMDMRDHDVTAWLAKGLTDDNRDVRIGAQYAVADILATRKVAANAFMRGTAQNLNDPDRGVRQAAVNTIRQLHDNGCYDSCFDPLIWGAVVQGASHEHQRVREDMQFFVQDMIHKVTAQEGAQRFFRNEVAQTVHTGMQDQIPAVRKLAQDNFDLLAQNAPGTLLRFASAVLRPYVT